MLWEAGVGGGGGGGGGEKKKMRARGFSIIATFIGKPSGSPCGGERFKPKNLKACPKRFSPK